MHWKILLSRYSSSHHMPISTISHSLPEYQKYITFQWCFQGNKERNHSYIPYFSSVVLRPLSIPPPFFFLVISYTWGNLTYSEYGETLWKVMYDYSSFLPYSIGNCKDKWTRERSYLVWEFFILYKVLC